MHALLQTLNYQPENYYDHSSIHTAVAAEQITKAPCGAAKSHQ
jgi:hypothetical protein